MYTCQDTNVIEIFQGSDYTDTVTITMPDGSPFDLTDYTVTSQLRDLSGRLKADFACEYTVKTDGVVTRNLSNAETLALTPSLETNYVWGIQLESVDGILPEIQGGAIVIAEVVKNA